MTTRLRIDAAVLDEPERTEEGYIRAEGLIAVPGILEYETRGGDTVKEYVPPETLRDDDFLASLEDKPLTLEHPDELLGPDNVRQQAIGHVRDVEYVEDGDVEGVKGTVVIQDDDGIEAFESGVRELSPTYGARLAFQSGRTDDGEFDRIQRKRTAGNHVALTRAGRAGAKAALRADGDAVQIDDNSQPTDDEGDMPNDSDNDATSTPQQGDAMPERVRLDSEMTITVDSDEADKIRRWKQDQEESQQELADQLESAKSEVNEFKSEIEELKAERDELQKQIDRKRQQLQRLMDSMGLKDLMEESEKGDPEGGEEGGEMNADMGGMPGEEEMDSMVQDAITERVDARIELLDAAETLGLDDDEIADKPNAELRRTIVEEYHDEARQDASDEEIRGAFRVILDELAHRTETRDDSYESASERVRSDADHQDAKAQYRDRVFG